MLFGIGVPFVVASVLGLLNLTALADFVFSTTGITILLLTNNLPFFN